MKGVKLPDAIATRPNGTIVSIEIKRTIKSRKRYAEIIVEHLKQRKNGRWKEILYLSPDTTFSSKLEKVVTSIETGRYNGEKFSFSPDHLKPFSFHALEDTDSWC
ncbi:MAG: hypothetical protein HON68_10290 [Gammaproteobacteria bacterium]|jgi:hypothetical protein|nr:hypothetical protein [Gammaproteobacteria bacterium]MBT3489606.1 hypothetical protein [Gammaproteobacteria bacterium]MBT3719090.1 hypothetical protein [Gammaproteobacteria bacterium]MBT3843957.1 hypothetical protein [Gammaproteobacteria bacterium]MBT3892123.1 hypothetical protein [Gammaproteobacteria bacterium]